MFEEYSINENELYKVKDIKDMNRNGKSGVIGIQYKPKINKWKIETSFEGKRYYLGTFTTFEEAVKVKLKFELEHYGKDNAPNKHLFEQYNIL